MKNIKTFNINMSTIILRFYLMMAVVIAAGFSGYWLVGLLALPIFLSIMLGVSIDWNAKFGKPIRSKNYTLSSTPKENFPNVA